MASDPASLIYGMLGNVGLGGQTFQNGFQAAVQPQQLALQRQALAAKVSEAQRQQQQDQAYQAAVSDWASKGSDPSGLLRIAAQFPDKAEAAGKLYELQDKQQVTSARNYYGQVYSGVQSNSPALVKDQLQRHRDAAFAAGMDTTDDDHALEAFKTGDAEGIAAAKSLSLAHLYATDPTGFAKQFATGGGEDYTLTPGSARFNAQGQMIASVPGNPDYQKIVVTNPDGSETTQFVNLRGGGGPASSGSAAGTGDVSRLINTDAGGGYVPDSVRTLGQFVNYGKTLNAKGARSSSAGTYQINGTTMREFGPKALGAGWENAPFNADTQDRVGAAIFDWAKQQPDPAAALKGRWVSLTKPEAAQLVQGDWDQAKGLIARKESGGGPGASANAPQSGYSFQTKPAGGDEPQLDDATVATMAEQYLSGDPSVLTNLGRGKQGSANVVKLRAAIANAARAKGMNGSQIAAVMQDYKAHQQGLNAFARGPEARTVRSLNVTIDHLDTLQNAAQALQNGDYRIFNSVRQKIASATGSATPTNFEGVKQIVSAEVAKAVVGGQTALSDRKDLAHAISTSNSPQQLAGYIAEVKKLLGGQLQGLSDQYRTATGRTDFADRLSPRTKAALGIGQAASGGFRILRVRPK